MTESEKEKIKLRAAYFNGLALLFAGLGTLGPFLAAYHHIMYEAAFTWAAVKLPLIIAATAVFAGSLTSYDFHKMALRELDKLSPQLPV